MVLLKGVMRMTSKMRVARLIRGLLQEDIALRCGCTTAWAARGESGKRQLRGEEVDIIAATLGVAPMQLFDEGLRPLPLTQEDIDRVLDVL